MRRWLLVVLLVAGCEPAIPSGGFRCSDSDQACPNGQHCACGLCVNKDSEAACAFDVSVDTGSSDLTVAEHQPLSVTVNAKAPDGSPATGFNGTVELGFKLPDGTRWADVRPSTLTLANGSGSAMVTVNRETIPPQAPRLTASFAAANGASPGITVLAPTLTKRPAPVAMAPFGWAQFVAWGTVIFDGSQFRMYFTGSNAQMRSVVGLALSPDGLTFTPTAAPVFPGPGSLFPSTAAVVSAAPFQVADGWRLAFYAQEQSGVPLDIGLASASDGLGVFDLANGGNPIMTRASCGSYCNQSAWYPTVLSGSAQVDGGAGQWLMFFTADRCNSMSGSCLGFFNVSLSIGRASSTDGINFQPEPAPVLSGDTGGEAYLAAPQVFLDGSVYKMYYAFAHSLGLGASPCDSGALVQIGYATSTDGFYWVRSPSNPVLTVGGNGWDKMVAGIMPTSVVPADGKDPESGLLVYYSGFTSVSFGPGCVPSNVGVATTQ